MAITAAEAFKAEVEKLQLENAKTKSSLIIAQTALKLEQEKTEKLVEAMEEAMRAFETACGHRLCRCTE